MSARKVLAVTCHAGHETDVPAERLALIICANNAALTVYRWYCPDCGGVVERVPDQFSLGILVGHAVRTSMWHLPAEVLEPHYGPPITEDEALDFALELGTADSLGELL